MSRFPARATLALALTAAALPALADTDYSALIRDQGLAGARATLSAMATPTASDRFALGGVLFLGAIERGLQTRWQAGLSDGLAMASGFPLLRLPIPENPDPAPFDPAMIEGLFRTMATDLSTAIDTLAPVGETDTVTVTINTGDLWFDIDMDGTRSPGEGFNEVTGLVLGGGFMPDPAPLTIAFDTADSAWLLAYAHLLSALSKTVLALSPTQTITNVLAARDAMETLSPGYSNPMSDWFLSDADQIADLVAIFVGAIEQRPDPALTAEVRDHLLAMVAANRSFWRLVALEQDNTSEWIPNKRQTSALPIAFPADTGARWLAVLSDAEALLRGNLLLPHWRLAPDAGISLARLFDNPPELDIIGIIQGETLVPYMESGRRIDARNLMAFEQLVGGDAGLFMVVLN